MTTEAAAAQYLQEHLDRVGSKGWAIHNPSNQPIIDLPVIYGFNNGGVGGFWSAVLLAEDGTFLGDHLCSDEAYMPADLGVTEGYRPDRHEKFQEHYPEGYRMEFVSYEDIESHPTMMSVINKAEDKITEEEKV